MEKNIFNKIKNGIVAKACYATALATSVVYTKCDVFDTGSTAASNLVGKLTALAEAVFPLVCIIAFLLLMFTRDERKLHAELKIIGIIMLAYAGILLVNNGDLLATVTEVIG